MLNCVKITIFLLLAVQISNQQYAVSTNGQNIPLCNTGNVLCYAQPPLPCQMGCNRCTDISTSSPSVTPPPTTTTTTVTTSTSTETPTTTACPNNSVQIGGVCRRIYCPKGYLYEGRCIEPKCSNGMVWVSGKCTAPGRLRTILEIETHFSTDANHTEPVIEKPKVINNVIYHTESPTTSERCYPKPRTTTETPTSEKCCRLVSPRMCKVKIGKWLCSHRHHIRCGDICGSFKLIFLTIPEITEHSGVVSMPPNPILNGCEDGDCTKDDSDFNDCSGCVSGQKETCSTYCYRFHCPSTFCKTVDQAEYCKEYPNDSACTRSGGCYHESCYNDYTC